MRQNAPVACHMSYCCYMRENLSEIVIGERENTTIIGFTPTWKFRSQNVRFREKNMTAGASGLIVHGKTVMFERSCQRSGSLRRKQRENAHVSWIWEWTYKIDSVQKACGSMRYEHEALWESREGYIPPG